MGSGKPTHRQEMVDRFALIALVLTICLSATGLLIVGLKIIKSALDGVGADTVKLGVLAIVGAAFLYLMAGAMLIMSFLAGRDSSKGSPRGFATMSSFFDGFWNVIQRIRW